MFPTDLAMCGAPLALVGESSVTVSWQSVESVIGCMQRVQRVAFKHTLSKAAMLNIHLYAYLLSPAGTILKLQEDLEIIQLNLNS